METSSTGGSLSADIKIENLSVEEFEFVLNQLTDHNLPEREKCPLVQHLNAEDARNNSYSSTDTVQTLTTTTATNGGGNVTSGCGGGGGGGGGNNNRNHNNRNNNETNRSKSKSSLHVLSKDNEFRLNHNQQQRQQQATLPQSSSTANQNNHYYHHHHNHHHPEQHYQNVSSNSNNYSKRMNGSNHNTNINNNNNNNKIKTQSSIIHQNFVECRLDTDTITTNSCGCGGIESSNHSGNDKWSSSLSTNNKSNMMMTSNIKATTTTASTIASMSPMSGSLLMSDSGVTAYGSNGGSKDGANSNNDNISLNNNNLKPNRANSFRMPSPSDNNILVVEQQQAENIIIVNNNNNNTSLSHQVDHLNHLHGRQFDHSQTMIERNVQDQGSTLLLNDNNSDSALENSSQSYGDINSNPNQNKYSTATLSTNTKFNQLQNRSSTMSINNINNMEQQQHSFSSQHLNSISSLVNKISKESPYRGILQSDNNNNKGIHFNNTNSANLIDGDCCEDNGKMYVEMKNLPQKANIIEYNADMKNNTNHSHHHHVGYKDSNSVDRVIEMPMLNSSRPIDDQYALNTTSSSSASPPNNSQFNYSYSFNNTNNINNNNSIIPSSGSVSNRREKKKKQKEEVKFSQDIEGHIGFMDISTLELIINNTSSSSGGVGANGNGNGSVNTDNNENNNNKKSGNKNHQKHDQNNEQISGQTKNNRNNNNHNENKKIITNNSMNNKNHSNSLSCDDISVDNNKNFNEIGMLNNTSPELSSNNNNNNKSKKNKSKRRQENSNNNHANNKNGHNGKMNRKKLTNSTSDSKLEELTSHSDNKDENNEKENDKSQNANNEDQTKKQSVKRQPHGGDGNVANSNNSSSDDFDDATDAEDEGEDDLKLSSILIRSKKSNSLLPTSKEIDLNDVQHEFCTVSDSEMDREKDFVTPKNKYLKRKKHLARNLNNSMPSSSSSSANHNKDTLAKNTNFAATASRNSHQHPPLHHQQQFHHYQHSQQPYMNQVTTGNKHSTIVNANHLGRGYESEREFSVNNNNSKTNPTCVSQSLSSSMLAIDGGVNKKPTNTSAKSLPPTTTSSLPQQTNSKEIVETKKVIEEFPSNTIHTANSENNLNIFLNDKDNCTGSSDNSGLKIPSYAEIAKSFNVTNAKPAQLATKLSSHSLNPTIENSTTTTSANINVVSAQNPDGVDDEFPQLDSSSTTKSEMVHNNNHDIEGDSVKSNNDNDVKNESADAIEHIAIADNGVETNAVANNADASDKAAKLPTIDQIGKNLNDNCRSDSFIEEDNQEEKTKIQKNINNNHPTSEMTHPKDNSVKNMTNNIPINSRSKNNNSVSGPVFIYGSESKNNNNNNKFWKHTGNNCDDDEKTQFTDNNPLLPDGFAGFWGGEKIVFGFFDDIQNEFDEIQDNCSLDKIPGCAHAKVLDSETIKVKASFTDQSEPIETLHENGGSENNDQIKESCPTNDISVQCNKSNNEDVDFESFKKNAVHVNDLENNWQKEASKTIIKHSDKGEISGVTDKIDHQAVTVVANPKRALSSTASSPLSSFDSSPVSSATTVSSSSIQSNQPKQPLCFISCLKKYRNISLNDNAELNITNYAGLINYIYNHWVNRKSL